MPLGLCASALAIGWILITKTIHIDVFGTFRTHPCVFFDGMQTKKVTRTLRLCPCDWLG